MTAPGPTPAELAAQIRFALHNLSARNGHHQFEDLCRYYARERISRNVLPATGPVSAGGDQGRDFETFRSFTAVDGDRALAFACTLQHEDRLPTKIKSDVEAILAGDQADMVYVFCGANLATSRRHRLIEWARAEHQISLAIIDGNALAEQLAAPDVYWIAQQFLSLPSQLAVGHTSDSLPCVGLPRRARDLIGRDRELACGTEWLNSPSDDRPVIAVTGPPGVGKTELGLALAQSARKRYPDGQFFVEVPTRGDAGDEPDLVGLLSDVIDGPAVRQPESRRHLMARLRSLLAGRRTLIVVDNIASEDAFRELLAISDSSAVICTSRSRLTGLAVDGARFIALDPLRDDQASTLAKKTAVRLTDEESRSVAAVCGGLPLAVLIAAAHIRGRPTLDVQNYLSRLADPDRGLEELSAGQRSMAAVIEYSYQSLSPTHARMVQALGVLPNTTLALNVIAAATAEEDELTDDRIHRTRRVLDDLFELNLVQQRESDGYRLHDVLYRFGRIKAAEAERDWRDQVVLNGCLMYAARAEYAMSSIGFTDQEARIPAKSNPVALALLEHDREGALALAETACEAQLWDRAVTVARILLPALRHLNHWADLVRACHCIQEAGEQTGNMQWVSSALHNLGMAEAHLGNTDEAIDLFRRSGTVAKEANDPFMRYAAYASYGRLLLSLGHNTDGIAALRNTLRAWRVLEDDAMLAQTLGNLGTAHMASGHLRTAVSYLRNGIEVAHRANLAALLPSLNTSLATVLRLSGHESEARGKSIDALERARAIGSRDMEAAALLELGMSGNGGEAGEQPGDAIAGALRIYREISDVQGQVAALRALGVHAKELGKLDQATQLLEECADLALQIGDAAQAAWSMARLARTRGDMGAHDEADELFRRAEGIAESTGNEFLIAEVRHQQANLLRHIGRTDQAIPLLRKTLRHLVKRGPSENLAATQALLGEALIHNNQWDEASRVLRPVAEAPSGTVRTVVRASAFRYLAVLYSRRRLWEEAEHAGQQALTLAQDCGSTSEQMHCRITRGNILARMGRWREASAQYDLAEPIASQRRDVYTLLTIRSNQATCAFKLGEVDKAVAQTRRGIEIARQLGIAHMEASLLLNLGTSLVQQGGIEEAIAEFWKGHAAASVINNASLVGEAEKNLARAYQSLGDTASAIGSAQEARTTFQSYGDWRGAAEALGIELSIRCDGVSDANVMSELSSLQSSDPGLPNPVVAAFWSMMGITDAIPSPPTHAVAPRGRRIHIAESVRERLNGVDVTALCAELTDSRRHCFLCRLPIAMTGQAELLALSSPDGQVAVTLAHGACATSSVISCPGNVAELDSARFEIECTLFDQDQPGVIVDCIGGGQGIGDNGKPADAVLDLLQTVGFIRVGEVDRAGTPNGRQSSVPRLGNDILRAHLTRDRLTVLSGDQPIMKDAPLSFLPDWYRATRKGVLIAMFGRNLHGMTWESLDHLIRAAQTGRLVGAALQLTITAPGRNSPCVCTPRTQLKYKRCCGRPHSDMGTR